MTGRSWDIFAHPIEGKDVATGANALDIARIGMDKALLTRNLTLLGAAYDEIHRQLVIQNATRADGIRADGTFGTDSLAPTLLTMLTFFSTKANTMESYLMATTVRITVINS